MIGPHELLDKIMEYGKTQLEKNQLYLKKIDLWNYVIKIDSDARKESLDEIIKELDARGWLQINNDIEIKFDPLSFQEKYNK